MIINMKKFKDKKEVFQYIKRIFKKYEVCVEGSSNKKSLKNFSDIDVDVFGKNARPYYEIVLVGNKLVLISAYFYKNKKNKSSIKDKYNNKQKIRRECQLTIDFMFKYLRTKNEKYLESVQKRLG
jgi:hypothetical protein